MPKGKLVLMAVQLVLIKILNRIKKLTLNITLKPKVIARRKGASYNANHRFIYILFLAPLNLNN